MNNLFRLTEDYIEAASEIAVKAFFNDPLMVHYFPDSVIRQEKAKCIFEYEIRYTIRYGEVYSISDNIEAIAAWRSPNNVYIDTKKQFECGAQKVLSILGKEFIIKANTIEILMIDIHKEYAPFPHWFLSPIVVDPKFQGRGYASILLRAMFERVDKENLPIYLHTHEKKNVVMYQHFRFKILKEIIIPGTEIRHWSMLRSKY